MIPLNSPELERIAGFLGKYEKSSSICYLAGLLTAPQLQANNLRLEVLAHLAVAECSGTRKPGEREVSNWLNRQLGGTSAARDEDPAEDVFVSPIHTDDGDKLVINGIWSSNDLALQIVIDVLGDSDTPAPLRSAYSGIRELLKLSDVLCSRVGLTRNEISESNRAGQVRLVPSLRVSERSKAVTFSAEALQRFGIDRDLLSPFVLPERKFSDLRTQILGSTDLERRPLVEIDGNLIVALPAAISIACRRFAISCSLEHGIDDLFGQALAAKSDLLVKEALRDLRNSGNAVPVPYPDSPVGGISVTIGEHDNGHYVCVITVHDHPLFIENEGMNAPLRLPSGMQRNLGEYATKISQACAARDDFKSGKFIIVSSALARGVEFTLEGWPNTWFSTVITLSELMLLSRSEGKQILRYLNAVTQKAMLEEHGVYLILTCGDFGFYSFWDSNNCLALPKELPLSENSMLDVGDVTFVGATRKKLRASLDFHMEKDSFGRYCRVGRLGGDSFFSTVKKRPIYASHTDIEQRKELCGLIKSAIGGFWIRFESSGNGNVNAPRKVVFELWQNLLELAYRSLDYLRDELALRDEGPFELSFDFSAVEFPNETKDVEEIGNVGNVAFRLDDDYARVVIELPQKFFSLFSTPENIGEQFLVSAISRAVITLLTHKGYEVSVEYEDAWPIEILRNTGARVLHLFQSKSPAEILLLSQSDKPALIPQDDLYFVRLGLASRVCGSNEHHILHGKEECNRFLNELNDEVWQSIKEDLNKLNRGPLIERLIENNEAIIADRRHWERTALAMISLHEAEEDVHRIARDRESERSLAALCTRTLLEMSICESPEEEGYVVGDPELNRLLAKVAYLLEIARASDAVHNGLVNNEIEVFSNGEFHIDMDPVAKVMMPFLSEYFYEGFNASANRYADLYVEGSAKDNRQRTAADELPGEFLSAFKVEYGLSVDHAIDCWVGLSEFCVAKGSVVVTSGRPEIYEFIKNDKGLSETTVNAFLHAFSLWPRKNWPSPPKGYHKKSLYPWRYRRPLSAVSRPIMQISTNEVTFGLGSLGEGVSYVLSRAQTGQLPGEEFFATDEMRRYIGHANREHGMAFGEDVGKALEDQGWNVRVEVNMSEFNAPKELGDLDVLAWKDSGEVLLIECKRLQLAKTVAEVAEICKRFRGEAKDELAKHVERVDWLLEHFDEVKRVTGVDVELTKAEDLLVTNTHVPMMYIEDLPVSASKIGPLNRLVGQ